MNPTESCVTIPRKFRILVTNACHLSCDLCWNEGYPSRGRLLISPEIARHAILSSRYSPESIKLTGGEPLLHPHIADIAQALQDLGPVSLTTSGVLLSRRVHEIPDFVSVTVSVYGTAPEEFARNTGQDPSLFAAFSRGAQALSLSGRRAAANVLIRPDASWSAVRYLSFCIRLGFSVVRFISLRGPETASVGYRRNLHSTRMLLANSGAAPEGEVTVLGAYSQGVHLQLITQYEELRAGERVPGFVWIGPRGEIYEHPAPRHALNLGRSGTSRGSHS